jgi:hypothetical protein
VRISLSTYPTSNLVIDKKRLERLRSEVQSKAKLTPWKSNILRHAFISYLYPKTNDENFVAAQSGNSPQTVHRHYGALAMQAEAERYFLITADHTH